MTSTENFSCDKDLSYDATKKQEIFDYKLLKNSNQNRFHLGVLKKLKKRQSRDLAM